MSTDSHEQIMRPSRNGTPVDAASLPGASSIEKWLGQHPEFVPQAQRLAKLQKRERRSALAFGGIASRILRRYDRDLNPAKLAAALTKVTGAKISRETVKSYRDAYRMYRLLRKTCGSQLPHLDMTKLAKAWGTSRGRFSDEDRVELCRRTAEKSLSRAQMKDEIQRISREKTRAALTYDVVPQVHHVQHMDGLDLLRRLDPEAADVIILDWMYKGYAGGDGELPAVHVPADPVAHLIECIRAARRALKPYGAVALFSDHLADPNRAVLEALETAGLTRKGQYISQKVAGSYSNLDGAPFTDAHETVDIYRRADVAGFPRHLKYEPSVSPKWHCRSHRSSAEREVHPFEKPVELMKTLISCLTVNGLVVDPFAGSGSSGVAAVQLGCSYRGAEMVGEYVEIANCRIALAADREAETVHAINAALAGADAQQQAAITLHLEQAGITLSPMIKEAAA